MSTGIGRRERKKLETRDRIVQCAVSLFASRGYESTTIEDIGDCADVSRATVFNYFARKEDLVLAWFERRRADLGESLAEGRGLEGGTSNRLRQGFRAIARLFDDDPVTGRALVRAWLLAGGPLLTPESETSQMFANEIRSGQQAGDVRPDIDADRAGVVLFDAYSGVLYRWVSDDEGRPFEDELLAALDLLLAGIALTPPGRTRPPGSVRMTSRGDPASRRAHARRTAPPVGVTIDDARAIAATLPRSYEALVRDEVRFRVGDMVYAAFYEDETIMGFAFPREEREALVASEPDKFLMPRPSDMRYRWVCVRLDAIDGDELRELLVDAWRMCVPKKVAAAYEG